MRIHLLLMSLMLAPLLACGGSDKAVVTAAPAGTPDREDPMAKEDPSPSKAKGLPSPEGAPDREQDPVAFAQWRIDQMFQREDVNLDGFLVPHEYQGPIGTEEERQSAFERIDADDDGRLTQEEVMTSLLAENPELGGKTSAPAGKQKR